VPSRGASELEGHPDLEEAIERGATSSNYDLIAAANKNPLAGKTAESSKKFSGKREDHLLSSVF
jgi:hypothetical protein